MKKLLAIILLISMIISLSACAFTARPDAAEETPAPIQSVDSPSDDEDPSNDEQETSENIYIMDETVIIDNDGCTFAVKSAKETGSSVDFVVFCENKTDKALMFTWLDTTINNYKSDPYWATSVAAGKKLNTTISFDRQSLEKYGLLPIDELSFCLHVYDSNDWFAEDVVNDRFTVYPTGMTADTVTYPERIRSDFEQIVVDNENGTFIILGGEKDSLFAYKVTAYIENKTNNTMEVYWGDVSVNDFMCDPYFGCSLAPHSQAYAEIVFDQPTFELNGIEEVESIEFVLNMCNANDWMNDIYFDDTFTFTPAK